MKKRLVTILLAAALAVTALGCKGGGGGSQVPAPAPTPTPVPHDTYDYTTTVKQVSSKNVSALGGGTVQITDSSSSIAGFKLTVPPGALSKDTNITVGEVSNPPALPLGLNYVGAPIDLEPDGTAFSAPATIEIPFSEEALSDAGVSSKTALKLYYFDKATNRWLEEKIISIDTANNVVIGEINHFSYHAVTGRNGEPPQDLGTPQPGDLLYKLTFEGLGAGWRPGHVGIYTGEKDLPDTKFASDDAKRCGKYNVVEAIADFFNPFGPSGVYYSYYNIPNTMETCPVTIGFEGDSVYMGAREPKESFTPLTQEQRNSIVSYAEAQIGKHYAWGQTYGVIFGLLDGNFVKGPYSFNCVGLTEKAYEEAGVNGGQGLVSAVDELLLLTPAEQYNRTKPAGGTSPILKINWASLTPNSGTECTELFAQISVFHTNGLNYIDSVTYVTDDGYTNPDIHINDSGLYGDLSAGDGIYSVKAPAGGDATWGTMGLTFTITDKSGKSASIHFVYIYTGTCYGITAASTTKIDGMGGTVKLMR